ncbi:MAG: hypothetical protein J0H37_03340, partial [Hyphomicrobium denitrificans]|nr:hypothetical protein [Hyphomicrobium denitrificans]
RSPRTRLLRHASTQLQAVVADCATILAIGQISPRMVGICSSQDGVRKPKKHRTKVVRFSTCATNANLYDAAHRSALLTFIGTPMLHSKARPPDVRSPYTAAAMKRMRRKSTR